MPAKNLRRVVSYVDKITHEEIKILAREEDTSVSRIVNKLIIIGLKNYGDGLDEEYPDVDWSKIPEDEVEKFHREYYGDEEE